MELDYVQLVYVMTPDKVHDEYTELDSGLLYHYANESADKNWITDKS